MRTIDARTIRLATPALARIAWRWPYIHPVALAASLKRPALLIVAYLALAVLFTWPLALHVHEGVTSAIDPVDSIWRIGWGQERLLHAPHALFRGNTFYPFPDSYLFDECVLGVAVLTLPLAVIGVAPLAIYNLALLLTLTLCGLTMYALARHLGAVWLAAFVAGVIYAFAPLHLDRIGHIGVLSIQWFPLILLLLDRLLLRPTVRDTVALAACLAIQAISSQYHALYLVLLVPLFLAVMFARRPEMRRVVVLAHLAMAGMIALAIVAPVAINYRRVQQEYDVSRTRDQAAYYSASLANFITPDGHNRLLGPLTVGLRANGTYTFERGMFAGGIALALAGIGLWHYRRETWAQFLAMLTLVAAVLALGPELRLVPGTRMPLFSRLPYDLLYRHVPVFDSMRVPARVGALYLLGIAGLAALGLTALMGRVGAMPRPRRFPFARLTPLLVGAVVFAGIGTEYLNQPLPLPRLESGATIPPVYHWLAAQPDAHVLELPLVIPDHERPQQIAVRQQYFSLVHKHRLVNGNATVLPKGYKALVAEMRELPSPRAIAIIQGLGITHVIVHDDQLPDATAARLREQLAGRETGLTLTAQFPATEVYRVAATDRFASLREAIPPGASVALSREDPMKTGAYIAMIGYLLRDHPLYTNLRVGFGQAYRGPLRPGARYDCAALFAEEDPMALGFTPADLVWQDDIVRVYRHS